MPAASRKIWLLVWVVGCLCVMGFMPVGVFGQGEKVVLKLDSTITRQPVYYNDDTIDILRDRYTYPMKFENSASFAGSVFSSYVDFSSLTFSENVDFFFSTFSKDAYLADAAFTKDAYFVGVTFSKDANFSFSTFSKDANFGFSTFSKDANFNYARFSVSPLFTSLKLRDSTQFYFKDAVFPNGLDFSYNPKIPNEINLTNIDFRESKHNIKKGVYKPDTINLFRTDISKFHLDYIHFKLLIKDSVKDDLGRDWVKVSDDEKESMYEALLQNFKTRGQRKPPSKPILPINKAANIFAEKNNI